MLKGVESNALRMGKVVGGHPIRLLCLALLNERTASPAELSRKMGVPVPKLSYHVRVLRDAGAIELVRTEPGPTSVEHFYRACQRAEASDDDFKAMSVEERISFGEVVSQLTFADIVMSMTAGTWGQRHDLHVTRVPLTVDEEGWKELRDLLAATLDGLYEVSRRTAVRVKGNPGSASIEARVAAFLFEMPDVPRMSFDPFEKRF